MSLGAVTLLIGVALGAAGCQGSLSPEPPVHLNWNMDQQNRFDPQEPNPFFENGMAQRPFVEGTVARGQLRADDHLHRGRDANGYVNALPKADAEGVAITLDHALMERGQQRYNIYCAPCHDLGGGGSGVVVQRALDAAKGKEDGPGFNPPPSFHDERLLQAPLGKLYDVITNGWGNMQPYASQIVVRDRWAITAYVRALQNAKRRGLDDVPAYEAGAHGWEVQ
jgi:mono/diheme cytochrome c family protein